jgi:hypothetical protein
MSDRTKPVIVIDHLKTIGRITDATARAAYGAFRLADAIYRLRTSHQDLIPEGHEIITIPRTDVPGNLFAEYRLVRKDIHA